MFKVGKVAVYPGHGVGKIESIEEKEFSGTKQSFYIMRILDTDMTIMVPVDGTSSAGLRCVIDSNEVNKVYEILKDLSLIHISEPTRLLSISYAVFCLKKTILNPSTSTTIHPYL